MCGEGEVEDTPGIPSPPTLPPPPLMFKKIKSGDRLMRERVTVSGEIVVSRQTYKPRERRLCIYAYCSLSHSHGLLRGVYFLFFSPSSTMCHNVLAV